MSPSLFVPSIYHEVLSQALMEFSGEDADQHGRLKEVKEMLLDFDEAVVPLTQEEEKLFYRNDIEVFEKEHAITKMDDVMDYMLNFAAFSDWKKLFSEKNTEKISKRILPKIRDSIMSKKGIFPTPECY